MYEPNLVEPNGRIRWPDETFGQFTRAIKDRYHDKRTHELQEESRGNVNVTLQN